ncbi:MAG: hypothetical protein EBE86_034990 [Hormoscilla sp. GUM202]|nr:hypothetical protein [Hormoscilla sp. GUM202]
MSQGEIDRLTREQQEAMLLVYREKWIKIATSTAPIDRSKAAEAVTAAYELIGQKQPDIIFVDSPLSACKYLLLNLSYSQTEIEDWYKKTYDVLHELGGKIINYMNDYFDDDDFNSATDLLFNTESVTIYRNMGFGFYNGTKKDLENNLGLDIERDYPSHIGFCICYPIDSLVALVSWYDYCISELNFQPLQPIWDIYQQMMKNAGWIVPFEKTCIVCSRPTMISLDNQQRLHAEGGPAIQYADGLSVYAYQGVGLPEKYGKLHPHQWRSQWILAEENAELRRVLIQGIGYEKMLQELQAIALDTWQEYTLLRIDGDVDVEPILLLKMTCPSTGFIHALRVPPDVESAREAIRWVNWEISPDEFQVQS